MRFLLLGALLFLGGARSALAHDGGENYLAVSALEDGSATLQWDLPASYIQDLFVENPQGAAAQLTAIEKYKTEISQLLSGELALSAGGKDCSLSELSRSPLLLNDKAYVRSALKASCAPDPETIEVQFKYLSSDTHAIPLLIHFESPGGAQSVLSSNQVESTRFGMVSGSAWAHFGKFVAGGIFHIWEGIDHILFLLTLLLPAVYHLSERHWVAREERKSVVLDVLKTVSSFTLAHSITLCLVTFGWLVIPSRLTESVIALSVLAAALNNIFPLVGEGRWKFAFLFGLVHGIGFAEVLVGMNLPLSALIRSLLGYNLGVELGQLAIVAAFLPFAFLLRHTFAYRCFVFQGGSLVTALIAAAWLVDRAFHLQRMPF